MKKIVFSGFLLIFLILFLNQNTKKCNTSLTLSGDKIVNLNFGEKYKEQGYNAVDRIDGNITKNIKISNNINYNKQGSYNITYSVKNSCNEKNEIRRIINIKKNPYYKNSYDKLDGTTRGWWSGNKKDHHRPSGGADINELKKYNAYFMGSNSKVIYLTFDEGSNDTYLKEIVDILDKNGVKGTFFLCGQFLKDNKDLIVQMVSSGHSIGNHTNNHKSMPSLATRDNFNEYLKEIQTIENIFYDITGRQIDKIYRDPRGEWSYRDLQIIKDLGYQSFFYSADYYDYDEEVSKEKALNELLKRYHNGAIYLIHPKNKGNYLALDSFIKELKKKGYSFDLVKNIKKTK